MKLFGSYTSPYVRHCRIALLQEGFEFELVETDYATSMEKSPTAKVPFFSDGDLFLTDSTSIIKYIREKSGQVFIQDVEDMDAYALVNTIMDSAINIFLLEKDGITYEKSDYLKRQAHRIVIGLAELNDLVAERKDMSNDFILRALCFLDWGQYRGRFNFDEFTHLVSLLASANEDKIFIQTAPP